MTATAELCGHPLPRGRRCLLSAGHRGLHAAAVDPCGHRWHRSATTRHTCILPADHHDDEPATSCRCRCEATTTRERTDHA